MAPTLRRITIYPIKSLDGVELDEAAVLPGCALADDRRFAIVDADGRFVNGKRTVAIHRICAEFDLPAMSVRLRNGDSDSMELFSLSDDRIALGEWFSDALGIACNLMEDSTSGFPDDTDAPGPTIVSTATLQEVTSWFPGLTLDEVRRRFRANLEIDGVEPFWEDRLVGPSGTDIPFRIGAMRWLGVTACQRCAVPARASETGEATPQFQQIFAGRRGASLPPWAPRERFDHYYRLAVNTRLAPGQAAGVMRVGNAVWVDSGGNPPTP
jgi:uncharacterized protein YcbX